MRASFKTSMINFHNVIRSFYVNIATGMQDHLMYHIIKSSRHTPLPDVIESLPSISMYIFMPGNGILIDPQNKMQSFFEPKRLDTYLFKQRIYIQRSFGPKTSKSCHSSIHQFCMSSKRLCIHQSSAISCSKLAVWMGHAVHSLFIGSICQLISTSLGQMGVNQGVSWMFVSIRRCAIC